MKTFTELYTALDATNRTSEKLSLLKAYFQSTPPADAAWAVYFLSGNRLKRAVRMSDFRLWAGEACEYPEWMVSECYDHVGDLAETLALLLSSRSQRTASSAGLQLSQLVEQKIIPLRELQPLEQKQSLVSLWGQMDHDACFVFNKLITGGFRVGVSQTLVHRALAEVADVAPAVMAHRLMGNWQPTAANYRALFESNVNHRDPAQPYPFCLAYPLECAPDAVHTLENSLGPVDQWQIEWKWDGIRAQLIKRDGAIILWSRGEEIVSLQFPEIVQAAAHLPEGVVLDGELLAWDYEAERVMPFGQLQRRLGRKRIGDKLQSEVPVCFMAYDLMEHSATDARADSTEMRRETLEQCVSALRSQTIRLSPELSVASWKAAAKLRAQSREYGVEGLMLKRVQAPYLAGRKKGEWWKWKVDPYTIDAVLVYAQQGHGRRAGLYTDYTFSVWDGDTLVPFAKAYSGLSDKEIREVDRWIRDHTQSKHGPVRVVDAELVFEIAFEGINESKRHKSGIAVRFPRIHRWRRDKVAREADSIVTVRGLVS